MSPHAPHDSFSDGAPLWNGDTTLYHVTLTKHVPSIRRKGLLMFQPANWSPAGNPQERYGGAHVFAFAHQDDAIRWAGRWDWELHRKLGTEKISIIEFLSTSDGWGYDTADPLTQAGSKGPWLKCHHTVCASAIRLAYPVTAPLIRDLIAHNTCSAHTNRSCPMKRDSSGS